MPTIIATSALLMHARTNNKRFNEKRNIIPFIEAYQLNKSNLNCNFQAAQTYGLVASPSGLSVCLCEDNSELCDWSVWLGLRG